ncbi:ribonuclease T2-like [Heterodontus francisci]|uniref:ribonuclease T2-like n=1 Tax=Heterodontus francisci TaxID=7792 RepID=UPI00355B670F
MAYQNGRGNQRKSMFDWIFLPLLVVFILPETSDCKNHPWHSLILSQHWPQTVCLMVSDTCKVPQNIDYWTVHGLWPKRIEMCNNSWQFNIENVKVILSDLKHWWPDVIHPDSTELWKHEWQKHGTCAATLESLDTQEKYFSKALELYQKMDLNSVLKKFDILPSPKYYMMENIEKALVSFYGVTPKIQCLNPTRGESVQVLGQIELCFNKDFQQLNCTEAAPNMLDSENNRWHNTFSGFSVCDRDQPIYYPPIEHLY